MDIIRALELLKKLEVRMEELYAGYHHLFFYDTEAAEIFLRLEHEERSHAGLIDFQIRMARKNRDLFRDVAYDAAPLNSLIARIEESIPPPETLTVAQAVAFSLEIESSACEYHYRTLIVESNPDVELLIKNLGISDQIHVASLEALAQRAGRIHQAARNTQSL